MRQYPRMPPRHPSNKYRRCIAVDETKLRVKKSSVDVDFRELLALEASYGRSSLNALRKH
jgi:hypothetical protein